MLPVVFEEFKMVYIFLLLVFLFTIIFDFSTNLGRAAAPPSLSPSVFYGPIYYLDGQTAPKIFTNLQEKTFNSCRSDDWQYY